MVSHTNVTLEATQSVDCETEQLLSTSVCESVRKTDRCDVIDPEEKTSRAFWNPH